MFIHCNFGAFRHPISVFNPQNNEAERPLYALALYMKTQRQERATNRVVSCNIWMIQ